MSAVVEEGLIVRLGNITDVKTLISDRAYSGFFAGGGLPAVGIELQEDNPQYHMGGESGISQALLLLNCWADDQATAKKLREAVRLGLSTYQGTAGPIYLRAIFISDGGDIAFESPEDTELRAYGVQLEAEVWYRHQIAHP